MYRNKFPLCLIALGIGLITILSSPVAAEREGRGAIFVMTNSTNVTRGNEVAMYERSENGDLSLIGFFPTGRTSAGQPQLGSGPAPTTRVFNDLFTLPFVSANLDGLGSSHSLVLGPHSKCLFAVNAGSHSLSSFRVADDGLGLISIEDSQGTFPVSLTIHEDILFVLNSGTSAEEAMANGNKSTGALASFKIAADCSLTLIQGSVTSLLGLSDSYLNPLPGETLTTPAQVSFTPDGELILVSIKGSDLKVVNGAFAGLASGRIVVFPVSGKGLLGSPIVTPFNLSTNTGGPFSFVFSGPRTVIVAHANSGTVAAYSIDSNNKLILLTDPITTVDPKSGFGHFATCWIERSGNYVYAASFDQPSGVLQITGVGTDLADLNGAIDGFKILKNGPMKGGLAPQQIVDIGYPSPVPAPGAPGASGNHGIDLSVVGSWLYFIQPRIGMIGRLTIDKGTGSLSHLSQFGGLNAGPEPFPDYNPAISTFLTKCFAPYSAGNPNPECKLGSAQGITGY
jgi:6-phosphogluconolactonase